MENVIKIKSGVQRPNWVCSKSWQQVFILPDKSSSHTGQKDQDVNTAKSNLVDELGHPINKDAFCISIIEFNDSAIIQHVQEKASVLAGNIKTSQPSGATNMSAPLEEVAKILKNNPPADENVHFLRPVVIFMSDGGHCSGAAPQTIADQVKQDADIVTVAFGDGADEKLLQNLATSPQHFYRCQDGRDLRAFLASVGETLTATIAQNQDATQPLAEIAV